MMERRRERRRKEERGGRREKGGSPFKTISSEVEIITMENFMLTASS